ncbi:MAG TPA: stage II sporulation protein M [Novosphingobium sp.]|nr:stage II sporulation protein M [Novosphingobium sp.]
MKAFWRDLAARWRAGAPAVPEGWQASLGSDRFRLAREADWARLERIVGLLEKGRPRAIADADLLALPGLYRQAASALAVARGTMLDAAVQAYLEALVQRAWFQLYGPNIGLGGWLAGFLAGGWPRAVRALAVDIAICLIVLALGTAVGWLLCAADPQWFGALVGDMAQGRNPAASPAALRATLFGHTQESGLSVLAAYLFGHNAQIALLEFALGFVVGVPSLLLLVQNAALLGAFLWLFAGAGLLPEAAGWLAVHGTTELFALVLAAAAGLHMGRAVAFPGRAGVLEAVSAAGRRAALVMLGVVAMLFVAGLLEGFARQLIEPTAARMALGGLMLVLWLAYFGLVGRGGEAP